MKRAMMMGTAIVLFYVILSLVVVTAGVYAISYAMVELGRQSYSDKMAELGISQEIIAFLNSPCKGAIVAEQVSYSVETGNYKDLDSFVKTFFGDCFRLTIGKHEIEGEGDNCNLVAKDSLIMPLSYSSSIETVEITLEK